MTWTTGKITCFALAVLELPQELGRREAADWNPREADKVVVWRTGG